jgi:hypothetical protein
MSGYKRPTNGEFNIHLAKRMPDRKASNVERSQANVDAWLKDLEEHRAKGDPTEFVKACNKNLDEYSKPHGNAWWLWTVVRNRAYRISVEFFRRGK